MSARRWIEFDAGFGSLLWWIVLGTVAIIPLLVVPQMKEAFRLAKDVFFLFSSGVLIVIASIGWAAGKIRIVGSPGALGIVTGLGVAWTLVSTVFSTNVALSLRSSWWVVCCAIFGMLAWQLSIGRSWKALLAVVIPAVITAVAVLFQAQGFPVLPGLEKGKVVGLLGNASDVGSYLAIAHVAALAVGFAWSRGAAALLSVLFVAAVLVSESITAVGTILLSTFIVFLATRPRATLIATGAVLAVAAVVVVSSEELRRQVEVRREMIADGSWDDLTNYRLGAWAAGVAIALDHPVTGAGPGTFGYNYLPRVIEVSRRLAPEVRLPTRNFAEAHNDHLEVLAETGVVGYLLFLSGIGALAAAGLRDRPSAASATTIGLASTIFILAVGQFPLQLAAPTVALLFLVGVGLSSTRDA